MEKKVEYALRILIDELEQFKMGIAHSVDERRLSEAKKVYNEFFAKKDKEYNHTYLGVPCKVINSRKIMRDIEFKDGSKTTIIYSELNS